MESCWNSDPEQRPTFTTLQKQIGDILESSLREVVLNNI